MTDTATDERPRYKNTRNGQIGILVGETEFDYTLEFNGVAKKVNTSNFKKFYELVQATGEELKQEELKSEKIAKKVPKAGAVKPNGDVPEAPRCGALFSRIISYTEDKGCEIKKTCSYTRIRFNKRNIAELSMPKKESRIKLMVRHEATASVEELSTLGRQVPPSHQYSIDHEYYVDLNTDITWIYKLIDQLVTFEQTRVVKKAAKPAGVKNGQGTGKQAAARAKKAEAEAQTEVPVEAAVETEGTPVEQS